MVACFPHSSIITIWYLDQSFRTTLGGSCLINWFFGWSVEEKGKHQGFHSLLPVTLLVGITIIVNTIFINVTRQRVGDSYDPTTQTFWFPALQYSDRTHVYQMVVNRKCDILPSSERQFKYSVPHVVAHSPIPPWSEWADLGCPPPRNVTYPSSSAWTQIIYVNFTGVARVAQSLMVRIKIFGAQIYRPVLGAPSRSDRIIMHSSVQFSLQLHRLPRCWLKRSGWSSKAILFVTVRRLLWISCACCDQMVSWTCWLGRKRMPEQKKYPFAVRK